jgi:hypothetical protein
MLVNSHTRLLDWDWLMFSGDNSFDNQSISYEMEDNSDDSQLTYIRHPIQLELFELDVLF